MPHTVTTPRPSTMPVAAPSRAHWLALAVLCVLALSLRFVHLGDPPLDYHPTRQLRSAIMAHWYFRQADRTFTGEEREVARQNAEGAGVIEPPIMEHLTAAAWHVTGENLAVPRALSSLCWVVGGIVLFLLAARLFSADVGLLAALLYLFQPLGVMGSRSFQPDPLMVMLEVMALYAIWRYHEHPTTRWLVIAGLVTGLTGFVKVGTLCLLLPAFFALALSAPEARPRHRLAFALGPRSWQFAALALLPSVVYYVYGMLRITSVSNTAAASFHFPMLFTGSFWADWLYILVAMCGVGVMLAALTGLLLARGRPLALLLGLWGGYLAYGLLFHYAIRSHNYYQLPFIPVLALSVGPLVALLLPHTLRAEVRPARVASWALLLMVPLISSSLLAMRQARPDLNRMVDDFKAISAIVGRGTRVVALSYAYGEPLRYYGGLKVINWPIGADFSKAAVMNQPRESAADRLSRFLRDDPQYFVITDYAEAVQQQDLQPLLQKLPVLVETNTYTIFDLRAPAAAP